MWSILKLCFYAAIIIFLWQAAKMFGGGGGDIVDNISSGMQKIEDSAAEQSENIIRQSMNGIRNIQRGIGDSVQEDIHEIVK